MWIEPDFSTLYESQTHLELQLEVSESTWNEAGNKVLRTVNFTVPIVPAVFQLEKKKKKHTQNEFL